MSVCPRSRPPEAVSRPQGRQKTTQGEKPVPGKASTQTWRCPDFFRTRSPEVPTLCPGLDFHPGSFSDVPGSRRGPRRPKIAKNLRPDFFGTPHVWADLWGPTLSPARAGSARRRRRGEGGKRIEPRGSGGFRELLALLGASWGLRAVTAGSASKLWPERAPGLIQGWTSEDSAEARRVDPTERLALHCRSSD